MGDGIETHRLKDGRILVILHPDCTITREAILALFAELGISATAVVFLPPEEVDQHCVNLDDVPVVIPVDPVICDASELDVAGRQCGQGGGRVIVLIGEEFPYQGLHPIAKKYGTQCGWSADGLGDCIKSSESVARDARGAEVTRPTANQVKCG